MADRRVQLLAGWMLISLYLGGCATLSPREASDGLSSRASAQAPPIQLSSFQAVDSDLHDPLAASSGEFGPSLSRLQVSTQTMFRTAYDDVVGILNVSQKRRWDEWATAHLQDGDIVFLQGSSNKVLGLIDFSKLSREVANSNFTHVGLLAVEDGQAYFYDVDRPGPGRIPFGTLIASPHVKAFAVKRLRPDRWQAIAPAVAYCRRVYQSKLPFDHRLKLGNDRLYCAEMIELAFRSGGQVLSRPVRWEDLPQIDEHPISVGVIQLLNGTKREERVVLPGNDEFGLWSSPDLELVLGLTSSSFSPAP